MLTPCRKPASNDTNWPHGVPRRSRQLFTVLASMLLLAPAAAVRAQPQPKPVVWVSGVGVDVSGNDLTKTAPAGWGNAGAISEQSIVAGDGYVELTASETNTGRMFGLSNGNPGESYTEIDYALQLASTGTLYVYENGTLQANLGSYATGDALRVEVEAGLVKYKRNGTVLYTSSVLPTYPLIVDTAFNQAGGTLTDAVVMVGIPVVWTSEVGVDVSGTDLSKTAAAGWGNAGAVSLHSLWWADGFVELTATETTTSRVLGLSGSDTDAHYLDIAYALHLGADGALYVYEEGTYQGTFGSYATGDTLRVAVESGGVEFSRNEVVFYSSPVPAVYPLLVDTAFEDTGATVADVVLGGDWIAGVPVVWTSAVGVSASTNNLTKTAAAGWGNAGAVSAQSLPAGDGYVELVATETTTGRMLGLSNGSPGESYTEIDYALNLAANGSLFVYENGTFVASLGGYATGEALRVEVESGQVKYKRNGTVLYTSLVSPTYPLIVDTAFNHLGGTLNDVIVSEGWQEGTQSAPQASPGPGLSTTSVTVSLTGDPGATIHYTTDGAEPTEASTPYSASLVFDVTTTLKAKAFQLGYADSDTTTGTYEIQVETPALSPPSGTYVGDVTLTTSTPGAAIHYTVDGSEPDQGSPSVASGGTVSVTTALTLKAKGLKTGATASATASGTYSPGSLVLDPPIFSPAPGQFVDSVPVALSSTQGADILYSTDGSEPSQTYTAPLSLTTTTTVTAKAVLSGWTPSSNAVGVYTIQAAAPAFDPPAGTYIGPHAVKMTSATSGAAIHYTTDGSEPNQGSTSVGNGQSIVVAESLTLKAKAFAPNTVGSDMASAVYTIEAAITPVAATGLDHSLVVASDGSLWAWGGNADGQIGDGSTTDRKLPVPITAIQVATRAAAGDAHSVALASDGSVWTWGNNDDGQLGDGTQDSRATPDTVTIAGTVVEIAAGARHTLALLSDGTVLSWGDNEYGQIGDGSALTRLQPTPVEDGTTVQTPPPLTDVIAIAAGGTSSVALKSDGSVWQWGYHAPLAASARAVPVQGLTGIVQIASGVDHTLALAPDGVIWAWGNGSSGQLGNTGASSATPIPLAAPVNVSLIAAGHRFSLAVSGAQVYTWGANEKGQLGDGTTGWGGGVGSVSGPTSTVALGGGRDHVLAIDDDGTTWGWGGNGGRLGDGTDKARLAPIQISEALFDWKAGTPVFSPEPESFSGGDVTLTTETAGGTIHYTLDGSAPDEQSASVASGGTVTLGGSTVLNARTFASGSPPSNVETAEYEVQVGSVTVSPGSGAFDTPQTVTVSTSTPGAALHYTLDGTTPDETDPSVSSGGSIPIQATALLKVRAFLAGATPSPVWSGGYTLFVATPVLSPGGGEVASGPVTVTTTTPSADLHYTVDGSTPTQSDAVVNSGSSVSVTESMTLRVAGWRSGWTPSGVASETYVVGGLSVPTVEPSPGSYPGPQTVVVRGSLDATLRFTTDGSDPTLGSELYVGPILVDETSTLLARAFKAGSTASAVAGGVYTIAGSSVVAPRFSVPGGEYATARSIVVTTPTAGVTIHYTTDGAEPTTSDPSIASGGSLPVDRSLILKAKAIGAGSESEVSRADYRITGAVAAGSKFSLALQADGTVLSWGWNASGRLGDGTTIQRLSPVSVVDGMGGVLDQVIAVDAGDDFGLALRSDGTVWAWGSSAFGQLGQGPGSGITESAVPIQVTVVSDVFAIAAGRWHALAATASGSVYAWGRNGSGQLGDGTHTNRETPALVQGSATWPVARALAAGGSHSAVLFDDGTAMAWGLNDKGQLGIGVTAVPYGGEDLPVPVSSLEGAIQLSSGLNHSQAVRTDGARRGSVWAWGDRTFGQIGDGIFSGHRNAPTFVLADLAYAAASDQHSFGYDRAGLGHGWGENYWWALGTTGRSNHAAPTRTLASNVFAIDSSSSHGLATRRDGYVIAWGKASNGAVGDGFNVDRPTPVAIVQVVDNAWLDLDDDGDGLSNGLEYIVDTDPLDPDTNGNGVSDGAEAALGGDPADLDTDDDGLTNAEELALGTDPDDADTDGDGTPDGEDALPLDPNNDDLASNPADTEAPVITLLEPPGAVALN